MLDRTPEEQRAHLASVAANERQRQSDIAFLRVFIRKNSHGAARDAFARLHPILPNAYSDKGNT